MNKQRVDSLLRKKVSLLKRREAKKARLANARIVGPPIRERKEVKEIDKCLICPYCGAKGVEIRGKIQRVVGCIECGLTWNYYAERYTFKCKNTRKGK